VGLGRVEDHYRNNLAEEKVWGAAGDHYRNNRADERDWGAAGDRCHYWRRLAPQRQRRPASSPAARRVDNGIGMPKNSDEYELKQQINWKITYDFLNLRPKI